MILAMPYLLGGVLGARVALLLVGAFVVFLLVRIAESFHLTKRQVFLSVLPMVICLPLVPASTQIYPDLPAGALVQIGRGCGVRE